jgi:hypothetical protein
MSLSTGLSASRRVAKILRTRVGTLVDQLLEILRPLSTPGRTPVDLFGQPDRVDLLGDPSCPIALVGEPDELFALEGMPWDGDLIGCPDHTDLVGEPHRPTTTGDP